MNTDNNARFQETENRIMQTYGALVQRKSPDKITVSDICREAGIHRTTFYGHYCDIIDLEEKAERNQLLRLLGEFQIEDKWDVERGILAITGFCRRHKDLFKRQMVISGGGDNLLFATDFMCSMEDTLRKYLESDHEEEHIYYRRFCEAGIMAVLASWIENDCATSDEKMTEIICDILKKVGTIAHFHQSY